jgi:hypothetical protein
MPVRKDGFIVGEVIQRILIQDVDFTFYVDASEDFPFSGDDAEKCVSTELSETSVESWRRAHNEAQTLVAQVADVNEAQTLAKKSFSRGADIQQALLELIAASPRTTGRIQTTIRAAFKRNKMRRLGTSPYVYLADPDVLLPDAPVLGAMVRGLQKHPKLGAVGVCYHPNNHVAAGAMLLRRKDWLRIGQIKGAGASCVRLHSEATGRTGFVYDFSENAQSRPLKIRVQ